MADNLIPGVIGYCNGRLALKADFAAGQLNIVTPSPLPAAPIPIDRLIISFSNLTDSGMVVIDTVPPDDAQPTQGGSTVTVIRGPAGDPQLQIEALIRVFIVGCRSATTMMTGVISASGAALVLNAPTIEGQLLAAQVNLSQLRQADLTTKRTISIADGPHRPFFRAVGLTAATPFGAAMAVNFNVHKSDDHTWYTPQLSYHFRLASTTPDGQQHVRLSGFNADWTDREISLAGLTECAPLPTDDAPGAIQQTLWIDEGELTAPLSQGGSGKWIVSFFGFPSQGVIDAWNRSIVEPYFAALQTTQGGSPVSGLPWLTIVDSSDNSPPTACLPAAQRLGGAPPSSLLLRWKIALSIHDKVAGARPIESHDFVAVGGQGIRGMFSLSLSTVQPVAPSSSTPTLPVAATLPGLLTSSGKMFQMAALMLPAQEIPSGFAFFLRWQNQTAVAKPGASSPPDNQLLRIGALDLICPPSPYPEITADTVLGKNAPITAARQPQAAAASETQVIDDGHYQLQFPGLRFGKGTIGSSLSVSALSSLPVCAVLPGGEDATPEDIKLGPGAANFAGDQISSAEREMSVLFSREPALIICDRFLGQGPSAPPVTMVLAISESSPPGEDLLLKMVLKLAQGATFSQLQEVGQRRDLIVIDRQPLFVGKLTEPIVDLDSSGDDRELAVWSMDGTIAGRWMLYRNQADFTVRLPPQGLGEAMEKIGLQGTSPPPGSIQEGQAIDFRFSPAASLQIRANANDQQYVVAPWDLRRIFGGDESDSAELLNAQFELLYGISAQIRKEGVYIAELQTLQGALPGELPDIVTPRTCLSLQTGLYQTVRKDWGKRYQALLSRLGILQPWMYDPQQILTLQGNDAISYRLRSTAQLCYPFPGEVPTAPNVPQVADGLRGGFAWAFPFSSVYDEMWRQPNSVDGELSRPSFSALGGWGFEKAVFANGKQTLYADTAMGRTFFYSLERIGRIGVAWNRAKHVIVYERSVVPSQQFSQEQDALLGRPIIRKTEEYVEVLVPIAKFGGQGADSTEKLARGCVLGIEFKTVRINVDSTWGSNVYVTALDNTKSPPIPVRQLAGYQIPLWNLDASSASPNVYPEPHIVLEFAGDPGSGSDSFPCEITNPENLVFYSSTLPGDTADTDSWAAVEGIDFTVVARPALNDAQGQPQEGFDFKDAGFNVKTGTPPPKPTTTIVSGYESFTWQVAPSDRKANLSVDRSDQIMGAVLHNVVVSRPVDPATATACRQLWSSFSSLQTITANIQKRVNDFTGAFPTSYDPTKVKSDMLEFLIGQLPNLVQDLAPIAPQLAHLDDWRKAVSTAFETFFGSSMTSGSPLYVVATLPNDFRSAQNACRQVLDDTLGQLQQWAPPSMVHLGDALAPALDQGDYATLVALWNTNLFPPLDACPDVPALAKYTLGKIDAVTGGLGGAVAATVDSLPSLFVANLASMTDNAAVAAREIATVFTILQQAVQSLPALPAPTDIANIMSKAAQLVNAFNAGPGPNAVNGVATDLATKLKEIPQTVNNTAFQLLKAFGDTPNVGDLSFNVDQLGYYFDAASKAIDITPALACLNQAASDAVSNLKPLGFNLPSQQILDGLTPAFLDPSLLDPAKIQLSDLLPNFTGLNLANLFPGLTLPSNLGENFQVRHGVDPQTLRAWVKVDVVFDLDEPAEIFSFGPVTVTLMTGHFEAHSSLTASPSGATTDVSGLLVGDWNITIGSLDIVTLAQTTLTFDKAGHLKFNLKPQNIQLNALLQIISDAIEAYSTGDDDDDSDDDDGGPGLTCQLIKNGDTPVGVEVALNLDIPPIEEATTGIANLSLGTSFAIAVDPTFYLSVGFHLGREDAPFTITIFILGGAGFIESDVLYYPDSGAIATTTDISIALSASLGISFGPVSGYVAAYLGIELTFQHGLSSDRSNNTLILTAYLLFIGDVDVAGIITVNIEVRLALAYYPAEGKLEGCGELSLTIKICWCFTLHVDVDIHYSLAGPAARGPQTQTAVQKHLAMFE